MIFLWKNSKDRKHFKLNLIKIKGLRHTFNLNLIIRTWGSIFLLVKFILSSRKRIKDTRAGTQPLQGLKIKENLTNI